MIKELTKLATHLDAKGLRREADFLDGVIRKIAAEKYGSGTASRVASVLKEIVKEALRSPGENDKEADKWWGNVFISHIATDQGTTSSTYSLNYSSNWGSTTEKFSESIKNATQEDINKHNKTGITISANGQDQWPSFLYVTRHNERNPGPGGSRRDGWQAHYYGVISDGPNGPIISVTQQIKPKSDLENKVVDQENL